MTKLDILEKLNEIFREVFDNEDINLSSDTTADDISGWDSLTHIGLIVAVEDCFSMHFAMGDIVSMKNVGEMVDIIFSDAQE